MNSDYSVKPKVSEPLRIQDVYACFETCWIDTPTLRGIKTYAKALTWRDADMLNRFIIGFPLDSDPEVIPPQDLFEYARRSTEEQGA